MAAKPKSYEDGYFGIKKMDADAKRLINEAADRDRVPVGEWVARAAKERVARERRALAGDPETRAPAQPAVDETRAVVITPQDLLAAFDLTMKLAPHRAGRYQGVPNKRRIAAIARALNGYIDALKPSISPRDGRDRAIAPPAGEAAMLMTGRRLIG